ncbi:hypothetical protein NL676_000435 [Syzygium grande]|nr:hypothetical protein NL676_000435 [Syzygium grande]
MPLRTKHLSLFPSLPQQVRKRNSLNFSEIASGSKKMLPIMMLDSQSYEDKKKAEAKPTILDVLPISYQGTPSISKPTFMCSGERTPNGDHVMEEQKPEYMFHSIHVPFQASLIFAVRREAGGGWRGSRAAAAAPSGAPPARYFHGAAPRPRPRLPSLVARSSLTMTVAPPSSSDSSAQLSSQLGSPAARSAPHSSP